MATIRGLRRAAQGFTLIELLVVVLVIGILAGLALPYYMRSVESSRADDAGSAVQMVGASNRMFALDDPTAGSGNGFLGGAVMNSNDSACSSYGCCFTDTCTNPAPSSSICNLYLCHYLASQDFDDKAYVVYAIPDGADGSSYCNNASNCTGAPSPSNLVACAIRRVSSGADCTDTTTQHCVASGSPYATWGYVADINGIVTSCGGAPTSPH